MTLITPHTHDHLFIEIKSLIDSARSELATRANSVLTLTYWKVGKRIQTEVLNHQRADYGSQIVVSLVRQLEQEYGSSFSEKNLRRMIQFAEIFSDESIVVSLIRQLSWTHFIALIPIKDPLARNFYAHMSVYGLLLGLQALC
jgi:hypothetical protein